MKKVLIIRTADTLCPLNSLASHFTRPNAINMIVDNAEVHIRHGDNKNMMTLDYDVIMVPKDYDTTHLIPCLRGVNGARKFIYY